MSLALHSVNLQEAVPCVFCPTSHAWFEALTRCEKGELESNQRVISNPLDALLSCLHLKHLGFYCLSLTYFESAPLSCCEQDWNPRTSQRQRCGSESCERTACGILLISAEMAASQTTGLTSITHLPLTVVTRGLVDVDHFLR
jgi:hypothetical protein